MMRQIISTKKLTEQELIHARSLSQEVICFDVIQTEALPFNISHAVQFDSLAFTSVNAVTYFLADEQVLLLLAHKTIFSISGKTTKALLDKGFKAITTADNALQLAAKIKQSAAVSVLHPCSSIRLNDLEKELDNSGIHYIPVPVYTTNFIDIKIDAKEYDALLFFSPSGVESFLNQNEIAPNAICCCIGETTARFLQTQQCNNHIIYPASPSVFDMLSLVANHINFKHTHE
ncbi:MAG: uroporphyrinogen-III synthase [Chitinophagaceae bacterium]|nr:uroporphyrinogen-III synthase [Chitinophagaceae bacterium]